MNKIIYKQKNKIALALLVLGGVVSNVGVVSSASSSSSVHSQECVTGGSNTQPDITLNPSQIRASDTGQNGDGSSLPGSSGDTAIVAPTPATGITGASNPEIRVTWMSGDTITSFPKTTYLAAIESIRAALGKTGRSIQLVDGIQPITNEEQFARVTGDIKCVRLPLSEKAKRDAEEIYEKLKTVSRFEVSTELTQFLETKRQEYFYDKDPSYILPNEYVNNFLRVYVDLICDGASSLEILIEAMENWKEKHESYKAVRGLDVLKGFKSIVTDLIDTPPEHRQDKRELIMTFLDNNRDTVQDRWSEVYNILDHAQTSISKGQAVRLILDTLQNWEEKNSKIPEERTNNDVFLASFADMITQITTYNDGETVEEKAKEFKTFLANNIVAIKDTLDQCKDILRSKRGLLCIECMRAWYVSSSLLTRLNRLCRQRLESISYRSIIHS